MSAPSTFQRGVMTIFAEFLNDFMKVFLDDFSIYGTKADHIKHLKLCLQRCRECGLSLNPEKCMICVTSGRLLGHVVCKEGLLIDPKKISVIQNLPPPTNVKSLRAFLGSVTYHRRFIWMFAQITRPLYALLKKDEAFEWTTNCQQTFELVKRLLTTTPILMAPNWSMEFHVHCDASNIAIGAVLAQKVNGNIDSPIYYASRLLNQAEKNYSTTEREALAMVYSVNKFRHYLLANHFVFYVDHQALLYLINRPIISGRIARWMLLLQEYDFEIVYMPGRRHVMADHLSRIDNGEPPIGVNDQLPDANLFCMEVLEEEDNYMEGKEQANEENERGKENMTPCLEWYMVYVQPTEDWRKPFKEYLKYGKLLTIGTTEEEQTRIRRASEPYIMDGDKLIRISPSGESKICIAGQVIEEIIAEAHEQEGHHQTFENTWFTILSGPYWWSIRNRDVASYCKECPFCLR